MKFLIVEDSPFISLIIRRNLEILGLRDIVQAANGFEAIRYMGLHLFDLVITDWMMPQMNGLELVRLIRSLEGESDRHTPILMLTANGMAENVLDALEAGVDDYMVKPPDPKVLKGKIMKLLGDKYHEEEEAAEKEERKGVLVANPLVPDGNSASAAPEGTPKEDPPSAEPAKADAREAAVAETTGAVSTAT